MKIEDSVVRLPYWDKLSENEKDFVKRNAVLRSYEKGTVLQSCDESCLGMIQVLHGSIRVLMISDEGREITLFRLSEGDTCVLSASCVLNQITFETDLITEEETQIIIVNSGAYSKLMDENINVKCYTYELTMERFSAVVWVFQQILFARFDQRLAGFLLERCERSGKTEIRMTQEAIAQDVNSAREVVARMLKQFSSDGLIELKRGSIIIKDKAGLKNLL